MCFFALYTLCVTGLLIWTVKLAQLQCWFSAKKKNDGEGGADCEPNGHPACYHHAGQERVRSEGLERVPGQRSLRPSPPLRRLQKQEMQSRRKDPFFQQIPGCNLAPQSGLYRGKEEKGGEAIKSV